MPPLIDNAREFVELTKERKRLDAELKAVEAKLAESQARLLLAFETTPDVMRVSINGFTVAPKRQVFSSPVYSREHSISVLKEKGYGQFVQPNYNANSVTALVRELERDGKLAESGLLDGFKLVEKFSISANAAGGSKNADQEANRSE